MAKEPVLCLLNFPFHLFKSHIGKGKVYLPLYRLTLKNLSITMTARKKKKNYSQYTRLLLRKPVLSVAQGNLLAIRFSERSSQATI